MKKCPFQKKTHCEHISLEIEEDDTSCGKKWEQAATRMSNAKPLRPLMSYAAGSISTDCWHQMADKPYHTHFRSSYGLTQKVSHPEGPHLMQQMPNGHLIGGYPNAGSWPPEASC